METVVERLNPGDNARVLIPPRSLHTWVGWLDSSQLKDLIYMDTEAYTHKITNRQ